LNTVLWVIAGVLAAAFLFGGAVKLVQPKEKLSATAFGKWAEDFSPGVIKAIGVLEILAAVGLILPAALDIAPILVPLAAAGIGLLMVGAAITHLRRHESMAIFANIVYLALAVVVAWERFGPHSFTS
jgi:uncharacterized membrane protein YphA (DoxX/SURF4 family)